MHIDDDTRIIAGVAPVACGTNMKKSGRVHVAVLSVTATLSGASEAAAAWWYLGVRLLGVPLGGSIIAGAAEVKSETNPNEHQMDEV